MTLRQVGPAPKITRSLYNTPIIRIRMQDPEPNPEEPQRNKQIIFIIAIYLLLTMSSHLTSDTASFNRSILALLKYDESPPPTVKTLMSLFSGENYEGFWVSPSQGDMLWEGTGKASMRYQKFGTTDNIEYEFQFQVNNGLYIDNGDVLIRTVINSEKLETYRNGTSILVVPKPTTANDTENIISAFYRQENVLKTVEQKIIPLEQFSMNITYTESTSALEIKFHVANLQTVWVDISIVKQQSKMLSTILFAILLFVVSYVQFSAIMEMLRAIFQDRQSAGSYSLVTVLAATMWDAVICVVAFIEAFRNEESLILFIMPAFLLCLLFTNLQLRILLLIFQAMSDNASFREIICKFNLITYGGLILMYPLLVYTNLSPLFFIALSLILLPQIYSNALKGQRPNIGSAYYSKFLSFRFLLILYLKCFPWNIFELEPNYFLGFSCMALLGFQFFMLWIQKQYGPKKVVPKFLLPPVFNYGCEIEMNVQQGSDSNVCAICLGSLTSEPEPGANVLEVPFRVMRGPCGHTFHGACLGQWMQIKMECPQCRSKLPPFQ